jgi:SAM-dependent methyltransferase
MWVGGIVKVCAQAVIDGRMNMQHYVLYNVFGKKHYLTEFKAGELPKRVLDIGCGTGIWIHDVAKQWRDMGHTDVEFVGIDLVPIQTPMVLLWKSV